MACHAGGVITRGPDSQRQVLLPLAAGLVFVSAAYTLSSVGLLTALNLVVMLALGAVIHERPWRTGAIATLPGLVFALLRAADDSAGSLAIMVAISPLAVAISGLVVRGGRLLAPHPATDSADLGANASGDAAGGSPLAPRRSGVVSWSSSPCSSWSDSGS